MPAKKPQIDLGPRPADSDSWIETCSEQDVFYRNALTSEREFSFTSIKTFDGREGEGYSSKVKRGTKVVGEVIDEGNGGSPLVRLNREDHTAFVAEARSFMPTQPPAEGNDEDWGDWSVVENYAGVLALASDLNKRRTGVVITDQDDHRDGLFYGAYYTLSGTTPADVATTAKYAMRNPEKNPLVWAKAQNRFVPAADLV